MTKEQALQLWDELFDGNDVAFDYASHEIHKEDYQNDDNGFGWDIDFKQPLASGGSNNTLNMTISSVITKAVRGGKPSFKIANFTYEVRKGKRYGSFEIFDVTDKNRPISMEPNDTNQDAYYNAERKRKQLEDTTRVKPNMFKNDFLKNLINPFKNKPVEEKKKDDEVVKPIFEAEKEVVEKDDESEVILDTPDDSTSAEVVEDENKEVVVDSEESSEVVEELDSEKTIETKEPVVSDTAKVVEDENKEVVVDSEESSEVVEELDSEKTLETEEPIVSDTAEVVEDENKEVVVDSEESSEVVEELDSEKTLETEEPVVSDDNHEYDSNTSDGDKKTVVENAEPLVTVTFDDDENEFVNTDTFKKDEWKDVDGKENAITSVSDAEFVSSCQETDDEIKEEIKPEVDTTDKVASTNFDFDEENKEEINPQYQNVETKIEEAKVEDSDMDEEEISKYIDDEDDETIIIDTDLDEPDENTDIGGLLHKIDDLKKLVSYLEKEQGKTKNEMKCLSDAFEKEKKTSVSVNEDNTQLNSQVCSLSVEKTKLEDEIKSLKENIENLKATIEKKEEENKKLNHDLEDLKVKVEKSNQDNEQSKTTIISLNDLKVQNEKKYAEMTQKLSDVSLSLASAQKNNEKLESDLNEKDIQIQKLLDEKTLLSDKNLELENTIKTKDEDISSLNQVIQTKNDEIEKDRREELFIKARIDDSYFDECLSYLNINSLPITLDNIYLALNKNPQWEKNFTSEVIYKPVEEQKEEDTLEDMSMKCELVEDLDVTYLTEEIERKSKALQAFKEKFKTENEAFDFSGRAIRYEEYQNKDSKAGWDFITLDDDIVIANLKSLADYNPTEEFQTNGHIFKVVSRDGKKRIESSEYVTDIYNFKQAMEVVEQGSKKQVPLVYIFIKFTGNKKETYDVKNQKKFNDLIEVTVQKACPHSFIKLQCTKSYTFITFDPTVDDAYKEIHRYSLLLNSYRFAFNKLYLLNAVIVVDKVMIPFNYRSLGFEQILGISDDIDMKAINYCLNKVNMVDSSISRLVHIGPQIVDDLPISRSKLTDSTLGKGNFEVAYGFNKTFYVMKFRFEVGVK